MDNDRTATLIIHSAEELVTCRAPGGSLGRARALPRATRASSLTAR